MPSLIVSPAGAVNPRLRSEGRPTGWKLRRAARVMQQTLAELKVQTVGRASRTGDGTGRTNRVSPACARACRRWSHGSWVRRGPRPQGQAKDRQGRQSKVIRPHPGILDLRSAAQAVPRTGVRHGFMSKQHRPRLRLRRDPKGWAAATGTTFGAGAGGSRVGLGGRLARRCGFTAAARQTGSHQPTEAHEHERERPWLRHGHTATSPTATSPTATSPTATCGWDGEDPDCETVEITGKCV